MASEKQYNNRNKGLEELSFHATVSPLDKDAAWKKLQALRNEQHTLAIFRPQQRKLLIGLGAIAAALLLYFNIPLHPVDSTVADKPSIPVVSAPKPLTTSASTASMITKPNPASPRKKRKEILPTVIAPVKEENEQDSVRAETGSMAVVVDSVHHTAAIQPPPLPKRVFHINELKDPDRPYTINKEKKKTTTPAARQELNFSIKINLSN